MSDPVLDDLSNAVSAAPKDPVMADLSAAPQAAAASPEPDDTEGDVARSLGSGSLHQISGQVAGMKGTAKYWYDRITGKNEGEAQNDLRQTTAAGTISTGDPAADTAIDKFGSIGGLTGQAGDAAQNWLLKQGVSPTVAASAGFGLAAAPMLVPVGIAAGKGLMSLAESGVSTPKPRIEPTMGPVEPPAIAGPADLSASGAPRAPYASVGEGGSPVFEEDGPEAPPNHQLPAAEQARRAQVLTAIGVPPDTPIRSSALTGDPMAAAVDGQIAKLKNSESGYAMQDALDTERQALSTYTKGLDGQGGTTIGNNETARQARGQTTAAGLGALDDWADTERRRLYIQANEDSGGKPVFAGNFHGLLSGDQADFVATTEGTALLKGIQARGKTLGFWDADGKPQPVPIQNVESMRQFLNKQWSPQTAGVVRDGKNALDTDVFTTGEGTPYAPARQFTQWQKNTLENPSGIAGIMDSSGAVNRKVAFEDIGKKAESMPAAQFSHIVDTLRNPPPNVPAPVVAKMQASIQALKSEFASQLSAVSDSTAGQANTRGVTKFMNDNSSKLQTLFNSPAEQLRLKNINDAHNILRYDASYPGAAAQKDILTKSGAATWAHRSITGLGGLAGGAIGSAYGPAGMATGASMGAGIAAPLASKVSGGIAERAALKATQGRLQSLSSLLSPSSAQ
jgi:hypothetical protein